MSYNFFSNKDCEFFPCHKNDDLNNFNCLFCYCPLYMLGSDCGGNFVYLENGIKDCSSCDIPHRKDFGYEYVQKKLRLYAESVKNV